MSLAWKIGPSWKVGPMSFGGLVTKNGTFLHFNFVPILDLKGLVWPDYNTIHHTVEGIGDTMSLDGPCRHYEEQTKTLTSALRFLSTGLSVFDYKLLPGLERRSKLID